MHSNKRYILFVALFIVFPFLSKAQYDIDTTGNTDANPPNYELIERQIADKKSDCYYPKLVKRFLKADTTLRLNQLTAFYYGYCYQDDYSPYRHLDEESEIYKLLDADNPDWKQVFKLADKAVKKKPTELTMLYWKAVAAQRLYGESHRAFDAIWQFYALLGTVYNTGTGSTYAPLYISSVSHAYFIMSFNNLKHTSQALGQSASGNLCDIYELEPNDSGIDVIYFDISKCMSYWKFTDVDSDDEDGEQQEEPVEIETAE